MAKDLFGIDHDDDNSISLTIYCDEIKTHRNFVGEQWFYMGMLLIPDENKQLALDKLNNARQTANYPAEMHFTKLTNLSKATVYNEKTLLAKLWLESIMNDNIDKCFYFNIVGLHSDNITWQFFGDNKFEHFENAYNRFFRMLLKGSLNNFFKSKMVSVTNVFHDKETSLQNHQYFNWNSIYRLQNELENVSFETDAIIFIDSNHDKEEIYTDESNFIQLIDLILGSFRHAFDKTTKREGSTEIAKIFAKYLKAMMDNPFNPQYFKKYSFSFFPTRKLKSIELIDNWERISSSFYNNRELLIFPNNQLSLFN